MRIEKISLENLRNYKTFEFKFPEDKNIVLFIGKNGKGKTNFLEAIYTLSLGRSFRSQQYEDLIFWDEEFARIKAHIKNEEDGIDLESFFSKFPRKMKVFKKNDVRIKHQDFLGNLATVLFHPEDLNMLYLSPSLRRKYMDITLSQTDKEYLVNFGNYRKVLKQRNSLLSQIRERKFKSENVNNLFVNLEVLNLQIIEYGKRVIEKRVILIDYLNKNIEKNYREISGGNEKIKVEYLTKLDLKNIEESYYKKLEDRRDLEILKGKTLYGPHLDDLKFFIDDHEISKSASRGEFRTLLLTIKLAEISFIKERIGEYPVLLLDDVFSELDIGRQKHFLKSIEGCQTIITATENFLDIKDDLEVIKI